MTKDSKASLLGDLVKKNKRSIILGFIIAMTAILILFGFEVWYPISSAGKFNPIIFATNTIGFLLIWLVTTFLVARLSAYKVLGVFSLLLTVVITTEYLKLPVNNPITLPALILFWLGIFYLLLPDIFKKYKFIVVGIYVASILYFYSFRTAINFKEVHLQIIVYFVTLSVSLTFIMWIYQQINWLITIKSNQTNTELALLKSQVNPHFFFNTLNNLYGLVIEKSDQAPELVLKLSDMMRYTIYEGKKDMVMLVDEIRYMQTYIELHEIRHQKKVDIQFIHEVDKQIKVAPLLFIILLENAFKHGVDGLTENALIHLELRTEKKQILFSIENNYQAAKNTSKTGIGLDNLRKRLEHIYSKRHSIQIEQTEDIYKVNLIINT
ncbi:sensor histidine kinase [Flagellimonas sp. S174]|uniref:sensor histidine kinase n=1 Tax=Flagellimonas sp. S174 TaxID=3410790 RepID=UPI003BF5653B